MRVPVKSFRVFGVAVALIALAGCQSSNLGRGVQNQSPIAWQTNRSYCRQLEADSVLDPIRNKIILPSYHGDQINWPDRDSVLGFASEDESRAIREYIKIRQKCMLNAVSSNLNIPEFGREIYSLANRWLELLASKQIRYENINKSRLNLALESKFSSNSYNKNRGSNDYRLKINIRNLGKREEASWRKKVAGQRPQGIGPRAAEPKPTTRPQSSSGSGFFVSKSGHVVTNAHVVKNCKRVTLGDDGKNQTDAAPVSTDIKNDLALLKLGSLETASAETKSLIKNLGLNVVPLAAHGLLRSEDVDLGESVLVAGFPFGDIFSNTIKVTGGLVSAVQGLGGDTGQFQLDAAVQPGNSGGPIYDAAGNVVGVVVSRLNKMKVVKVLGSLPENTNFGIKASTVRQFLTASGLPSKWSTRTKKMSTTALAKIAQRQTLMVICHK